MAAAAEWNPPFSPIRFVNTVRLVPSRYPTAGILDQVASPEDLEAIIELETWTNDRISTELGTLHRLPEDEWVIGEPMSSVFHRTQELEEIGVWEAAVQVRAYYANFHALFADIRQPKHEFATLHDPSSYSASQAFARQLLRSGANGVVYRSVRDPGGECIACFRPKLVRNVRMGPHFEYRWDGRRAPAIRRLQ